MNFDNIGNALDYNTDSSNSNIGYFNNINTKKNTVNNNKPGKKKSIVSLSENFALQKYFHDVGQENTFDSKQEFQFAIKIRLFERYQKDLDKKITQKLQTLKNLRTHQQGNTVSKPHYKQVHALRVLSKTTKLRISRFKTQFTISNLKLVISLAKNFSNRGLPYSDLIQEGNLGLLKAIDKFDPHKGYKFSTYASWWIQQSMNRAILDQSRLIRLPVKVQEEFFKIKRSKKSLSNNNGSTPNTDEISEHLGIDNTKIKKIERAASLSVVSLDTPKFKSNGESSHTIQDFIPDTTDCIESYLTQIEMSNRINKALSNLSEREKTILNMRFGIGYTQNYTLDEIGNSYDLTRERIRQIERSALMKIRNNPDGEILKEYLT